MDESLLARLADVVTAHETTTTSARRAAELIRSGTQARWIGIYTVADGMVTNEGWSGPAAPAHLSFPDTGGLSAHAIQARSVVVSNDVARDPRYLTNQDDSGSELIVPVLNAGRVVGTLDVESDLIGAFGGAEITCYEDLAQALRPLWTAADR